MNWKLIIYVCIFVVLLAIHIGLGLWRKGIKTTLDVLPNDVEIQKQYKIANTIFKLFPYAAVVGIIIGLSN